MGWFKLTSLLPIQDWDFKWEKGHCLNSLGKKKFELCRSNLTSPNAHIPKGVKRVHEIFENPTFMGSLLPGDIKQGSLGNCWFVASLTGLANVPDGIRRICVEYDTSKFRETTAEQPRANSY